VCTLARARTNERQFRDRIARPYTVLRKSLLVFAILPSGTRETASGSSDEIVLARVDRRERARVRLALPGNPMPIFATSGDISRLSSC